MEVCVTNKVMGLYSLDASCDYHRVVLPLQEMGVNLEYNRTQEELDEVKILYFNRIPQHLDKVLASGKKLVMDLDDYWHIYPHHPIYKDWVRLEYPKRTEDLLRKVDAVTVTTPILAEKVYKFNKNVIVIPNAIPDRDQFIYKEKNVSKTVRFGYLGGSSHLLDVRSIESVFNHFPTLDFTLFGYTEHKIWRDIEDVLSFNRHNPNYEHKAPRSLQEYMLGYDEIDVAIAPLTNNEFNKHKSSLKFYEAAAKKCGFICSDMSPYADDVPRDIGFLCKNNKEWVEAIKKCKNIDIVKERGELAYKWLRTNRNLANVNKLRIQLFESL